MNLFDLQETFLEKVRQGPGYIAWQSAEEPWRQKWHEYMYDMLGCANNLRSTHNIYVSLATFPNPSNNRLGKLAEHLCSFWADIDRHENSAYKTDAEIKNAIEKFIDVTGLPHPTI